MLFHVRKISLKLIISPLHELFMTSYVLLKFKKSHNRYKKEKEKERKSTMLHSRNRIEI